MNLLKPVNVLLLAAFLLYSVDTVYNAPSRSSSHACSMAELLPRRNNAEVLDDALYVAGNVLVRTNLTHSLYRLLERLNVLLFQK